MKSPPSQGWWGLSCWVSQVAPSIIRDISFVAFASQRSVVSLQGGSLKRLRLCVRRNCGDSRLSSKIPERVSLAEFRVGLRVEKKSKYFRKLQISSSYENLQKHSQHTRDSPGLMLVAALCVWERGFEDSCCSSTVCSIEGDKEFWIIAPSPLHCFLILFPSFDLSLIWFRHQALLPTIKAINYQHKGNLVLMGRKKLTVMH